MGINFILRLIIPEYYYNWHKILFLQRILILSIIYWYKKNCIITIHNWLYSTIWKVKQCRAYLKSKKDNIYHSALSIRSCSNVDNFKMICFLSPIKVARKRQNIINPKHSKGSNRHALSQHLWKRCI